MPCYQTGSREGDMELSRDEAQKENTRTTRMLCATLREFEKYEEFDNLPADVKKYWAAHKKVDAERKRRAKNKSQKSKLVKRAKSKLTQAELQALELR